MPNLNDTLFVGETELWPHDLRQVWSMFTEGIVGPLDLKVTAGATGLSVDVAAGVAYVLGDDDAGQGNYQATVEAPVNSDSFAAGGLIPADATNPRIDVIVLHVYDDEYDGSGSFGYELEVLTGTPTSGATLANRNGAAAVPNTALWLADVLVPATATSIVSGDIGDKRVSSALVGVMSNALVYKGAIDCSANPNYPAADAGDTYVVSAAGKIGGASGIAVEIGDLLLCKVDGSASGTQAAVGANWDVIQGNLVGAVSGPAAATDSDFVLFDGTTGKLVKDGGLSLDIDGTLGANSDARIPSQKAVKTAIAAGGAGAGSRKAIFDHFVNAGNSGTTLTTLYTDTVAANTLANNGDKLHFTYTLDIGGHATRTRELLVEFGGITLFDTATFTSTAEQWGQIEGSIIRVNSSTIRATVRLIRSLWSDSTFVTTMLANAGVTPLDFTTGLDLKLKAQVGASGASNEIVALLGIVEFEPKA